MDLRRCLWFTALVACGGCAMFARHEALVPERRPIGREIASKALTEEDRKEVARKNDFAFRLARGAKLGENGQNGCLSPVAADMGLSLVLNGVQGDSFDACAKAMGLQDPRIDKLNATNSRLLDVFASLPARPFSLGNSIWSVMPFRFNPTYQQEMAKAYDADVIKLGSAGQNATERVNSWIGQRTRGHIRRALSSLDPKDAVVVLTSATFVGTLPMGFAPAPATVKFQSPQGAREGLLTAPTVADCRLDPTRRKLVGLPLEGSSCTLWALMPDAGTSVTDTLEALNAKKWSDLVGTTRKDTCAVTLPPVSSQRWLNLQSALGDLGADRLFGGDNDMTPMSHELRTGYGVSKILQQVVLKLDRQGAPTNVPAGNSGTGGPFVVNRPFLYLVTEDTSGVILFLGALNDPSKP